MSTGEVTARRAALPGARVLSDGHVLYWWAEILAIGAFYIVYSFVRNLNGGGGGAIPPDALANARQIISVERALGIYHELTIQRWALEWRPLIIAANYFYGSLHFVVTIFTGVFLYRRFADDYPRFRNTLAIATAAALIGFSLYPLAPPRLLGDALGPGYEYVDTLLRDPAIWSFNSGGMQKISNQFAAMPSVHVCWSTWCALALAPRCRRTWTRTLAISYPIITLVVIVITANHFFLDAVGGLAILGFGWIVARHVTRAGRSPVAT
ncbi:MAG: phosphatase PAP2 family protein [Actinomycetota bacterium]